MSLLISQISIKPSPSTEAHTDGWTGDHYTSYTYSWLLSKVKIGVFKFSFFGYQSETVQSMDAESKSSDISPRAPVFPLLSFIDFPGCMERAVIGAWWPG